MSGINMQNEVWQLGVEPTFKLVLLALAETSAFDYDLTFLPSDLDKVSEMTGFSTITVTRTIHLMVMCGILVVLPNGFYQLEKNYLHKTGNQHGK